MADNSSIASRMQKLAKLKRRKSGGDADADPVSEDVTAPELDSTEEPAPILMPGPTAETADNHEDSPAPDLDSADSPDEAEDKPSNSTEASDEDDESLEDYFAALGMDPADSTPAEEAPAESADAILDHAEKAEADVETTQEVEADDVLDEINLGVIDDDNTDDIDDILAAAEAAEADAGLQESAEIEPPDFTQAEIDPETLAREFEDEVATARKAAETDDDDSLVSVTFDESRSTLLNHVSRQMSCSVDDVVVTALDWYLDALFGEDEQQAEATG